MLAFEGLVQGRVAYHGAQGSATRVPRGHCKLQAYEGFVSISWHEDGAERTAVVSALQFESYLEAGAVVITGPAQPRARPSTAGLRDADERPR